jgi:antitoxin (DNA-binding transcriptional repressor) of toxin-antitoxin stability system
MARGNLVHPRTDPMTTITIQEAQAALPEIIHRLHPGEEVVITENDQPIARLIPTPPEPPKKPRQLGTMRGSVLYMAPDFDAPLEDFKEYME